MTENAYENRLHGEVLFKNEFSKFYFKLFFKPFEIWIDVDGLPNEIRLAAMLDYTPFMMCRLADDTQELFVNVSWVIESMKTTHQDYIRILERRRNEVLTQMAELIKKHDAESNKEKTNV